MKDFILDADLDLFFENGDFKIDNSEAQAISLLLFTGKGHWKASPKTGIAFEQFVNSNEKNTAITQVSFGLQDDGAKIKKLQFKGNKLEIEAEWDIL